MKKLKILQGIRQGKIGGGESYLMGLVENLDPERYEPVVLSFTDGPMVDHLRSRGIQTEVLYTEKPFDWKVWPKVANLIRRENIDLVHAHGTRAMSNLFRPAKAARLPLIYTCHGWSFHRDQNPVVKKLRILSEKYLTGKADINICGARANRTEARELFGKFNATIIYNSIDHERFNPSARYKDLREEWGLSAGDLVIASVARFTLQKQPLKLIQAFAAVCKEVPNATLLMVGDGEEKQASLALIKKLGIENRVCMQPFRQDVPEVLAAADIFVLPSLWEVFPIALLEAMSMGKAVVATAVGGTPEMVQHGHNGLLIDVNQIERELATSLVMLCRDEALRQRLSATAISTIYNRYSVSTLARRNENIYESLVKMPGTVHQSLPQFQA